MVASRIKISWRIIFSSTMVTLFFILLLHLFPEGKKKTPKLKPSIEQLVEKPLWEQTLVFEQLDYSNITGHSLGMNLVPNYVHFVFFGGTPIDFIQLICILAAYKNQKPDKIYFHFDQSKTFTGKYWRVLTRLDDFTRLVVFNYVKLPEEAFGKPLNPQWRKWHGSDLTRISVLMKYGGIYLDNDCYLVNSLDKFRKFEFTLSWDEGEFLGNQVLIGHKDARFLKKYLDCYKEYDQTKWYYNAGEKPTREILFKQPHLIHRVKEIFGVSIKYIDKVFQMRWDDWRKMSTIHLLAQHQYLLKSLNRNARFPVQFNEMNIAYYPVTFREMVYDVYDVANIKWPKRRIDS